MSTRTRRERELAQREQMIVSAARDLAEAEGWEAVTTRRLAERIEYSQPVLYSHFTGKDAIVTAVALEGFGELARELREARAAAASPGRALAALGHAYIAFAASHPAVYDAMFVLRTELRFGAADTPAPLREGFRELHRGIEALDLPGDAETLTETFWAALHGLVTLGRGGRLRPGLAGERLDVLVDRLAHPGALRPPPPDRSLDAGVPSLGLSPPNPDVQAR